MQSRTGGRGVDFGRSLIFVAVDFLAAMLIRATGHRLQAARNSLDLTKAINHSVNVSAGDVASLIYLWNPWAILTCVGSCTSPIENSMVVIMIYGACSCLAPLAAFGYVMATHLSLYPAILIVPVILLLGYGPDTPPPKVFLLKGSSGSKSCMQDNDQRDRLRVAPLFSSKPVVHFIFWLVIWSCYVLLVSSVVLKEVGGLHEMFEKVELHFCHVVKNLDGKKIQDIDEYSEKSAINTMLAPRYLRSCINFVAFLVLSTGFDIFLFNTVDIAQVSKVQNGELKRKEEAGRNLFSGLILTDTRKRLREISSVA